MASLQSFKHHATCLRRDHPDICCLTEWRRWCAPLEHALQEIEACPCSRDRRIDNAESSERVVFTQGRFSCAIFDERCSEAQHNQAAARWASLRSAQPTQEQTRFESRERPPRSSRPAWS